MAPATPLGSKLEAQRRLHTRLLISYKDFHHAEELAQHILGENLHARAPDEPRLVLEALSCAMVMSYCRPFSGNRPGDLPKRFLRCLDPGERQMHARFLTDRKRRLAHSDADAWKVKAVAVGPTPWGKLVLPLYHDVRAPLTREDTETLRRIASKLMAAILEARRHLDRVLVHHLEEILLRGEEFFSGVLRIIREHEAENRTDAR